MQILCNFAAAVLILAWIRIRNTSGLIVFYILYGVSSGAFVSLGGPICFNLCRNIGNIGTRLGILTSLCGIGLLVGNPIAGAILDRGDWMGLQIWAGFLILISTAFQLATRVAKRGWCFTRKV